MKCIECSTDLDAAGEVHRKCNMPVCQQSYNSCCERSHRDWRVCENCGGHCCPGHSFRYDMYTLCWNCHGTETQRIAMIRVTVMAMTDKAITSPHRSADDIMTQIMEAIENGTIDKVGAAK